MIEGYEMMDDIEEFKVELQAFYENIATVSLEEFDGFLTQHEAGLKTLPF